MSEKGRWKENEEFALILVTAPPGGEGERIARTLVEEKLAACVNRIGGIRSTYRWKGAIEEDGEELLLVKARRSSLELLEARVREIHPYEVPEVIALSVTGGSGPYLDWLRGATEGG